MRWLVLVLLVPGCFFTDPVNGRPTATIQDPAPANRYRGDTVTLNAHKSSDPDGDPLTYRWRVFTCSSPGVCAPPFHESSSAEVTFQIPTKELVYVGLTATDPGGAQGTDLLAITPVNRAPSVDVQLQAWLVQNPTGGYTLGRALAFVAEPDDDDDTPPTPAWELFPPPSSIPANREWSVVADGRSASLRPDVAGSWTVKVTVTDPEGASASDQVLFTVDPDQPPCIAATSPPAADARYILERTAPPRRFAVETVIDDLDPYPLPATQDPELGGARFRWWLGAPALAEVPGHDLPDLVVDPAAYAPGDVLTLRVEVADRVPRELCPAAQPTCALAAGCWQRLSWTVEIR